jgi:hypothetical protein
VYEADAAPPWLVMFLRRLALERLTLGDPKDPLDVTLYRSIA